MRRVRQDAECLVNERGLVRFGTFAEAIGDLNLDDAQPWPPFRVPRWFRRLRLKEWEAFQITHGRYFILLALFDAKLVQLVQIKVYDRETKQKRYFERKLFPGAFRTARSLLDSVVEWRSGGDYIRMENALDRGVFRLSFEVAAKPSLPAMRAQFEAKADGVTPMVVSIPFAQNRGMYSHKALLPLTGTLEIDGELTVMGLGSASLMTDDHKGYYGRIMNWDWCVGAAWRDGRLEGFNLTRNASMDPDAYNENGFWIDGELHYLPAVTWTRDGDVWTIRDREGLVDVRFEVEAKGDLFMNLLLVESRYMGPIGNFSGSLRSPDGATLVVDGMFGMGERFWLKS